MEDFCDFSLKKWQKLQALSQRMLAVKSLLGFFNSDYILDRELADDCESLVDCLLAELDYTIEVLVQLLEDED